MLFFVNEEEDEVRGDFGFNIESAFNEASHVLDTIADEQEEPDLEECEDY